MAIKKIILVVLLLNIGVFAQEVFEIKKASKIYDVRLEVEKCDDNSCQGEAKFSIFRKGQAKAFQIFNTPTEFMAEEAKRPNAKMRYGYQSVVFFEDYNFDGQEDLAIRDGNNGGYGGSSYQIYLFSLQSRKFVRSSALTNLNQGAYLGMMEVDKKKKFCELPQNQAAVGIKPKNSSSLEIAQRKFMNGRKTRRLPMKIKLK